jgi:hypothetical protein
MAGMQFGVGMIGRGLVPENWVEANQNFVYDAPPGRQGKQVFTPACLRDCPSGIVLRTYFRPEDSPEDASLRSVSRCQCLSGVVSFGAGVFSKAASLQGTWCLQVPASPVPTFPGVCFPRHLLFQASASSLMPDSPGRLFFVSLGHISFAVSFGTALSFGTASRRAGRRCFGASVGSPEPAY